MGKHVCFDIALKEHSNKTERQEKEEEEECKKKTHVAWCDFDDMQIEMEKKKRVKERRSVWKRFQHYVIQENKIQQPTTCIIIDLSQ